MAKNNLPLKVALGYAAVVVVLVMAIWLVYTNTQSILSINQASRDYIQKREKADSTMTALLKEEQNSLRQLSEAINAKDPKSYLKQKMNELNNGKDSVVVHQKVAKTHEAQQTTVEITKSKKGFFRRLADAFKKEHAETLSVHRDSNHAVIDTITPVNVAENVADILEQIDKKEKSAQQGKAQAVSREMKDLQMANAQLALRSAQQLNDIHQRERIQMQQSINQAMEARQHLLWQIELLAIIAIVAVLILFAYIWQDNKKDRIYRENLEEANEEIREANEDIKAANEEIQRVMKQRERLLLTITHDIKAPAASISGFIDLLKEDIKGERAIQCLNNMKHSATHLSQLVASLLDYHQLENKQIQIHSEPFSPALLIQQSVEEFSLQAQQKGLKITCDITDNTPDRETFYLGDAFRIHQIINNLLSNAIKYTDHGSILVTASWDNQLILRIADTGKGMTAEETQKIFQAFTRLKSAQGIEGTGLGLSITHELIKLLGGNIQVESEVGKGSKFTVILPIKKAENTEDKQESTLSLQQQGKKDDSKKSLRLNGNKKILILDDDKLQLQLLQEILHRTIDDTWQVFACLHVSEALTLLHNEQPSLMLLDVEMPEMNGMDFIRHINHSQMKVVAMTAHDSSILEELQKAGFDDCLFKPFTKDELMKKVAENTESGENILKEEEKANKKADENEADQSLFAPLLAFAGDDPEAEAELIQTVKQEMSHYESTLKAALDAPSLNISDIGMTAHKLLPIATMLQLDCLEELQSMVPEDIQDCDEATIREYTQTVIKSIQV